MVPCFIINYNRLTLLKKLCEYLSTIDEIKIIIIDNNSDYEPLLEWYSRCPYEVARMDKNYGHKVFWECNLYEQFGISDEFIITDSDLDLSMIPKDFLNVLRKGLKEFPHFDKCGFSLEINDLPKNKITFDVVAWEQKFWNKKLTDEFYEAQIDTTFALYHRNIYSYPALRTAPPYVAKHVPWYYECFDELPPDEQHYLSTLKTSTHWAERIKNKRRIPKVIHQLWIGPLPAPMEMIQTWIDKNPTWKHVLWDEQRIREAYPKGFRNQRHIDEHETWNGKTDMMRYEILYDHGGFFLDADCVCINPLDDFLLDHEAFTCWENEIIAAGLMCAGYVATVKNCNLMKLIIDEIAKYADRTEKGTGLPSWKTVGQAMFSSVIKKHNYPIHVYPSYFFVPVHHTGLRYSGTGKSYADQKWGSTKGYDNI